MVTVTKIPMTIMKKIERGILEALLVPPPPFRTLEVDCGFGFEFPNAEMVIL